MRVAPYDDDNVTNNDVIIRRVNPDQHIVFNENTQTMQLSSKLFSPSSELNGGMSVDLLRLIEEAGRDAKEFVTTPIFTGSVCFIAGSARAAGLRVGGEPLPDNPFHGEIWGNPNRPNKFTRKQKNALINASKWFVQIPDVSIK